MSYFMNNSWTMFMNCSWMFINRFANFSSWTVHELKCSWICCSWIINFMKRPFNVHAYSWIVHEFIKNIHEQCSWIIHEQFIKFSPGYCQNYQKICNRLQSLRLKIGQQMDQSYCVIPPSHMWPSMGKRTLTLLRTA